MSASYIPEETYAVCTYQMGASPQKFIASRNKVSVFHKGKPILTKEDKNLDAEIEKIELESLYKELETYNDYIEYKKNARIFNDLITNIQKNFEEYFNSFLI